MKKLKLKGEVEIERELDGAQIWLDFQMEPNRFFKNDLG
jgi:hypothetical protein